MRNMIRLIMFICLASAVTDLYAGPSEKRFEGKWVTHKLANVDFGILLHQDGNQLTGYHSAVTKDAMHTDTPDLEGSPSITGTIKGDTAIVDVHSTYSDPGAVLEVRLTLHGRSLDWKVLQVKQSGEHFIPDKATLSKEH